MLAREAGVLVLHSGFGLLPSPRRPPTRSGSGGRHGRRRGRRVGGDGRCVQAAAGLAPRLPERRSRPLDPSTARQETSRAAFAFLNNLSDRLANQVQLSPMPDRLRRGNGASFRRGCRLLAGGQSIRGRAHRAGPLAASPSLARSLASLPSAALSSFDWGGRSRPVMLCSELATLDVTIELVRKKPNPEPAPPR